MRDSKDEAKFLKTRAKVQEGLVSLEAGDYLDDDEAFAEVERLIAIKSAKAGNAPRGASARVLRSTTP